MIENLTKCEREGGGDLVDPSDLCFMRWSGGSDVADFPVPQNARGRVAVTWGDWRRDVVVVENGW